MNPVDEFARLKAEIRRLQDRADVLRDGFLHPNARLRSNQFEITVKRARRRVFVKERLPEAVLSDPRYWEERESEVVTCRAIAGSQAAKDDIVLIE
ncbi:MAG: hypothetical protein B7Z10_02245 [Rhodobacterales bacterium 32-66-7]|nr:MAG: hypothetical protein B7Z10_02245 [Rhodobacterales bacterium 32-66-7]